MSVAALVEQGRRAHAQVCIDTVTVTREGAKTLNASTGDLTQTPTAVYTGPARIQLMARASSNDTVAGDREQQVERPALVLPWSAPSADSLKPGDIVTITASSDPSLTGKSTKVVGYHDTTTTTAHKYLIEEVQ